MIEHRNKGSLAWHPKVRGKEIPGTVCLFVKPTRLPSVAEEKTVVPTELKYDRGQRRWNHELTDIKFLPSGKKEVLK